jgi:phospholipid N-methyltransferase
MIETLTYVKNFLRDRQVASITPTSQFGVKGLCSTIDFKQTHLIVEYGPGTGVFTNYLLKNMRSDGKLIAIERNKDFGSFLSQTIQDPRAIFFNDSAENVIDTLSACKESEADYVISGIPFMWIPEIVKDKIIENTYKALKPGGKFLVYQTCLQMDYHLKDHLEQFFGPVQTRYEIRNFPPLRLYEATKTNGVFHVPGNGNNGKNGNGHKR